jgi:hypothetical protein
LTKDQINQLADKIRPPPGKTADDLEREGGPPNMPKEVFAEVVRRLRENPDAYRIDDPDKEAASIKLPPGITAEAMKAKGRPS